MSEVEKLARIILPIEGSKTWVTQTIAEEIAKDILDAGYLPVEPAQLEVLLRILRDKFVEYLTIDSETHDARRKEFNQAIFFDPHDNFFGGRQVFNNTDLDMVMEKFNKAIATITKNEAKGQLYRIKGER